MTWLGDAVLPWLAQTRTPCPRVLSASSCGSPRRRRWLILFVLSSEGSLPQCLEHRCRLDPLLPFITLHSLVPPSAVVPGTGNPLS